MTKPQKSKFKDPHKSKRRKIDLKNVIVPELVDTPNTATYLAWKTARENLEREIDLFWRRGLYFWTFIAAIFVARAASYGAFNVVSLIDSHANVNIGEDQDQSYFIQSMLSALGFLVSICWTLAGMGSKYWQRNWEIKVSALELKITGQLLGDDQSTTWMKAKKNPMGFLETRFSVSKLSICVSVITALFWFALFIYDLKPLRTFISDVITQNSIPIFDIMLLAFVLIGSVLVVLITYSKESKK